MSGFLRNIERGRENAALKTETCVHCGRKRRPHQVWRTLQLGANDYICIDEASCIEAARSALIEALEAKETV